MMRENNIYCLGKARDNIIKLLERYSRNGVMIRGGEREDMEKRLLSVLNYHIRRIYSEFFGGEKRARIVFCTEKRKGKRLFGSCELCGGMSKSAVFSGNDAAVVLTVCGSGTLSVQNGDDEKSIAFATPTGLYRDITLYAGSCENACVTVTASGGIRICKAVLYTGLCGDAAVGLQDDFQDYCPENILRAALPEDFDVLCSVRSVNGVRKNRELFRVGEHYIETTADNAGEYVITYKNVPPEVDDADGDYAALPLPSRYFDLLCIRTAKDLCTADQSDVYARLNVREAEIASALCRSERAYDRTSNRYYAPFQKTSHLL